MTRIRQIVYWLPVLVLALSACTREALVENTSIIEGEKAILYLRVNTPEMKIQSRSALPDEDEKKIISLCIFIFDHSTGALISNTIHENAGAHASDKPENADGIINPNSKNYIAIETLTGNSRDIYVIANYHSSIIEDLKGVSTIDEVKQLVAQTYGNPITRNYGMVMTGILTNQPVRKTTDITVPLQYISAKITVKVINKCDNLDINGWTADGLPIKSYVFERAITSDPNYHDATNIIDKHDYYYDFSDQCFDFETTTQPTSPTDGTTYESTFYMLENRRGGRVEDRQDPPATAEPRQPYQLKAWYAPDNATRVRILGKLNNAQPISICINHYLGANNTDDYNIYRSTHYTYTITIHSLTSIDIDTNIEQEDISLSITPPADLENMDAHFDFRPFLLKTNELTDPNVKVSAEVLQAVNSDLHAEWLNLSIFPVMMHHVRKNMDAAGEDIARWQQEGDDNTYVRPKYIPNSATRTYLIKQGKDYMGSAIISDTNSDYPESDESLPYTKATHRMCKKITDIPTGSIPISIYLYADEYEYNPSATAPSYREAVIRFTVQKGNESPKYTHFTVRQYPPYRFARFTVNNVEYMLVTERMEEYEHCLQSQLSMNLQMSTGMQWGPYDLTGAVTSDRDGFVNTLQGVYTATTGDNYYKTYLSPKYGSATSGWDKSNNGEIYEGAGTSTQGTPYFNLPLVNNTSAYHAIYNSTAARYCHEKNHDLNGDGQIDASETFWYLPSKQEMQLFWTFHEAINLHADYYWSSTESDTEKAYAVSMQNSPAAPHQTYNGVPQALSKTTALSANFPRVRCVRRVNVPKGTNMVSPLQPIVSHRTDGTTVVDCSNLPNNMYTSDTKTNIIWGDVAGIQHANQKVFKKFEIERKDNEATDYNTLHKENGKCDTSKGWRLPTQREMLMVYTVKDLLEANSNFSAFQKGIYWTMTCDLSAQYVIDFNTGLCQYDNYFDSGNKFYYRCVREIQ